MHIEAEISTMKYFAKLALVRIPFMIDYSLTAQIENKSKAAKILNRFSFYAYAVSGCSIHKA